MSIFAQLRDGLRLSRYVPLGTILRNRRKQRRAKRLVREYCRFLCLDALKRTGLAGELLRGDIRVRDGEWLRGFDPEVVFAVAEYLAVLGFVRVEEEEDGIAVRLTSRGRAMLDSPAGFPELILGYRRVLEHLPGLLRGEPEARGAALRDEALVREASTALGYDFAYPLLGGLIAARRIGSVLELGSSRLALLKFLCDRYGVVGWGIEIDPRIASQARDSLRGTLYEGRLHVIEGDALAPAEIDIPAGTEAILAVDLLHLYLLDRGRVVSALSEWRRKLPSSAFIIVEVCRRAGHGRAAGPLPKPEYDLCHRLTGQDLPEERDWLSVFSEAGYRLAEKRVFPSLEHGAFVFLGRDA